MNEMKIKMKMMDEIREKRDLAVRVAFRPPHSSAES
jgi:hypothetical protein